MFEGLLGNIVSLKLNPKPGLNLVRVGKGSEADKGKTY